MVKLLLLFFGTLLLLRPANSWARRRSKSREKLVAREEVERQEVNIDDPTDLIEELEHCDADVVACGFTLKCQCCSVPNFSACEDNPEVIGFPELLNSASLVKRATTISDEEKAEQRAIIKEARKFIKTERAMVREARKEIKEAIGTIKAAKAIIRPKADEAGCHLRATEYNGQSLCLPGNVAAMMIIIDNITAGECMPSFPSNCSKPLDDKMVYAQYFEVKSDMVEDALASLNTAGYPCETTEDAEQLKCII